MPKPANCGGCCRGSSPGRGGLPPARVDTTAPLPLRLCPPMQRPRNSYTSSLVIMMKLARHREVRGDAALLVVWVKLPSSSPISLFSLRHVARSHRNLGHRHVVVLSHLAPPRLRHTADAGRRLPPQTCSFSGCGMGGPVQPSLSFCAACRARQDSHHTHAALSDILMSLGTWLPNRHISWNIPSVIVRIRAAVTRNTAPAHPPFLFREVPIQCQAPGNLASGLGEIDGLVVLRDRVLTRFLFFLPPPIPSTHAHQPPPGSSPPALS